MGHQFPLPKWWFSTTDARRGRKFQIRSAAGGRRPLGARLQFVNTRPGFPRARGSPASPTYLQASVKSFLKGLHSQSTFLVPKWIAFLPAIPFFHLDCDQIRNPFLQSCCKIMCTSGSGGGRGHRAVPPSPNYPFPVPNLASNSYLRHRYFMGNIFCLKHPHI